MRGGFIRTSIRVTDGRGAVPQILEAYETLIDPARRSRYDAGQRVEAEPGRQAAGFEGFDFSTRGADYSATFGDLFAECSPSVGRGRRRSSAAPTSTRHAVRSKRRWLACSARFSDAARDCRACAGTGRRGLSRGSCQLCQGTGAVRSVRGHMVFSRSCSACGGTGQQTPRPASRALAADRKRAARR